MNVNFGFRIFYFTPRLKNTVTKLIVKDGKDFTLKLHFSSYTNSKAKTRGPIKVL